MRPQHLALVAVALLAGTAGYLTHRWLIHGERQAAAAPPPAAPAAAPEPAARARSETPLDWSFAAPDGTRHTLREWAGGVLVVNFWATWCPPCREEIPAFIDLQKRYGARGLRFVGVALDQAEPVADFAAEEGINYPVLVGDADVTRLMQALGNDIGGLPYTAVLDRAGEVLLTHQGEWAPEAAEAALVEILNDR